MSKGPATESELGDLHSKIAKVMINALDNIEAAQETWTPELEVDLPEVPPALLSVMVKFLDSNKITCAPEAGNSMSAIQQKLMNKAKTRKSIENIVYLNEDQNTA